MTVMILSVAAVGILQALAMISRTAQISENHFQAYSFALSKMAEVQMNARKGEVSEVTDEGRFRIGMQEFTWQVAAQPVASFPTLESRSLKVAWKMGPHSYEKEYRTFVRIPKEDEEEP